MVVSETSPLVVLGEFKCWMDLAFVRQILMFDKFAPGILAVIKGRATGGTPIAPVRGSNGRDVCCPNRFGADSGVYAIIFA